MSAGTRHLSEGFQRFFCNPAVISTSAKLGFGFLCMFLFRQYWLMTFVILFSQFLSFDSSIISRVEKYLTALGSGLPNGFSNRAATRMGML